MFINDHLGFTELRTVQFICQYFHQLFSSDTDEALIQHRFMQAVADSLCQSLQSLTQVLCLERHCFWVLRPY